MKTEIILSSGIRTESSGTYFPGNVDENFPFTKYLALASQTYHFKFNDGVCRITSEGPSSGKLVILVSLCCLAKKEVPCVKRSKNM